MEILAIIPARGGSKGIKRKNIREMCGKPLVGYTIDAAHGSKYVTRTIVSTEDAEIKEVCEKLGAEVMARPCELACDEAKTAPVMLHVAEELEKEGYKPDYILLLQATCPLRDAKFIDDACEFLFKNLEKGYDSCFSAFDKGCTHALWRINPDGTVQSLYDHRTRPRRQELERHHPMICESGAFYLLKYDVFKEVKDFIGKHPIPYVTEQIIDIDEEKDFQRVAEIVEKRK